MLFRNIFLHENLSVKSSLISFQISRFLSALLLVFFIIVYSPLVYCQASSFEIFEAEKGALPIFDFICVKASREVINQLRVPLLKNGIWKNEMLSKKKDIWILPAYEGSLLLQSVIDLKLIVTVPQWIQVGRFLVRKKYISGAEFMHLTRDWYWLLCSKKNTLWGDPIESPLGLPSA